MTVASTRLLSLSLALVLAFAALLSASAPDGASAQDRYDRRMVVINETGRTIREFYATNTGVRNWGRDLLGEKVIPPGQQYVFDFNDGTGYCMFDFRAVLDNGRPIELYRVNVCQYASWKVQ
jgi:hypothetical protein